MPFVEMRVNSRGEPSPDGGKVVRVYEPPKMRGWDELVEEVQVPGAVAVAIGTNRPELLAAYQPTADDAFRLANLCRVLVATNRELAEHSQYLAERLDHAAEHAKGMSRVLAGLQDLANFRPEGEGDDDE